jgi:hypothetical protein
VEGPIKEGLVASYGVLLVDELLVAYKEAKRNFYLGGQRLAAVEGGRFCEAAIRMLQQRAFGKSTPIGKQLDLDKTIRELANLAANLQPDSVRLHIPRAIRVVYDVRNSRDAAHLGDGIDPNLQDATLVSGMLDWILAEFVRLHHNVSADEAQRIVNQLVARQAPTIQDFGGFLKVLRPNLQAGDHLLLLLYQVGEGGASLADLERWSKPDMRANLRRTLRRLVEVQAYVHEDGNHFYITMTGLKEVERRRLLEPTPAKGL